MPCVVFKNVPYKAVLKGTNRSERRKVIHSLLDVVTGTAVKVQRKKVKTVVGAEDLTF